MRRNPSDHRAALASVIMHLRQGQAASRIALARRLGASASTLGLHVEELIEGGWVKEEGAQREGALGRPQRKLTLQAKAGLFVGVEFNAQRIQLTMLDFCGRPVHSQLRPLQANLGRNQILQQLESAIDAMVKWQAGPILGIGIAAPGLIDRERGIALRFSFIDQWRDVPLAQQIRQRFGSEVTLENNLRVIALAERWFGAARDLQHFAVLGPRSGLGMGVISHGQLLRGAHQNAGEIGLLPWQGGETGAILQDALSATAIYRRLCGRQPAPDQAESLRDFFAAAKASTWNPALRTEIVRDFALLLRSIQVTMDLQRFFLHGPLTALGSSFCEYINTAAAALLPRWPELHPPRLEPSHLGDDAGALGAATLAMENWRPPPV